MKTKEELAKEFEESKKVNMERIDEESGLPF